jgi:ATP-dependent Clp protease ATP-binding subunit ClpA
LSEYKKYNETNPIFEKYFQYVLVKETSVNDCISILRDVKRHIESDFDGKKFLIQFSIDLFIYIFLI